MTETGESLLSDPAVNTLEEKLRGLPMRPGVYLMKDAAGRIIYVGKARALRNRVRSYFQKIDGRAQPRVAAMVSRIRDLDYVVTDSEVDALILEGNLIKQHKPRDNVLLKDDKAFPFIKITKEPFPQVVVTRKIIRDGARYFGPYTDGKAMRRTLELIRKVFPLRTCANARLWPSLDRPCLDYYIHRCPGPCKGHIDEAGYEEIIQQVGQFLSGKKNDLIRRLKEKMLEASANLQFELAARLRDQIGAIDGAVVRQRVVTYEEVDRDIIGYAREGDDVCMAVLQVREGKLLGKEHFFLTAPEEATEDDTLNAFLSQYYLTAQLLPDEILAPREPEEVEALKNWLEQQRKGRVHITVPQRGDKAALVRMAGQNAQLQLSARLLKKAETRERLSVPGSVLALQEALKLDQPPRRIETFDISNIQGSDPVASMVCFIDGKPRKSEYRKFKIKEVIGPNDFAMMQEVVGRRYQRILDEEGPLPDLVVIDGGKGQLSSAKEVLDELGLVDLPVIGLAKRLEEVFFPGQPQALLIPRTSPALKLLMQSRDEAHRFALTFHRQQRNRRTIQSEVNVIPGVGPKRAQMLLKTFGSVEKISVLSVEELTALKGVSRSVAQKIYDHFHPDEGEAS